MKKIMLFVLTTLLLTSCFGGENKTSLKETEIDKEIKIIKEMEGLINNQNFDKAIPKLEKIYSNDTKEISNTINYMTALLSKGSISREEKEYSKKALTVGKKALKEFPKDSELYRSIGYAYEIAEDYDNAFKNYDKSIELNPNNFLAYANRGHAYKLFGDYTKAESDFLKAYELNKTNDFVLINLAWVYDIILFDFEEALKYYNEVIKITKNIRFKSEAYHSIGNIYIGKGRIEEAEKSFIKAIESDPKFELGYLGLSEVQMAKILEKKDSLTLEEKNSLLKESLKNNEIAISLNPGRAMSYYKKGIIINDIKGLKDKAKFTFKIALLVLEDDITLSKKQKENLKIYINNKITDEK